MPGKRDGEITRLLGAFSNGEPEAEARLMELTYRELRKIAAGHMRRERSARSLLTTDLVHEAYLRLVEQADTPWATVPISFRSPRMSCGRARSIAPGSATAASAGA